MSERVGGKRWEGWFFISGLSEWVSGDLSANPVPTNAERGDQWQGPWCQSSNGLQSREMMDGRWVDG